MWEALIGIDWLQLAAHLRWPLTASYLCVLGLICVYGVHRYFLVAVYYRHKRDIRRARERFTDLPRVTVQIPMYNERYVAERVIEACCGIDYPRDRLQVQVLDDSTDETAEIAAACCERLRRDGRDVDYRHRDNRAGFKAGALDEAMSTATGELIAIFDADFVPPPSILKRTVHHFTDDRVGMVQTCWDHLNREASLLTRSQAIYLDGHFLIEHTARNRSGRWMNFNGTAGIWRREAIESAGGWQHDTLTEDVDLSYRAQLAGWRFLFLPHVKCPAELPPEMMAFKSQQHRWTKGSIQAAKKLLPAVWRSPAPLRVKLEAVFHLTSPLVYLFVVLMTLLFFPAFFVNMQPVERGSPAGWLFGLTLFSLATASAGTFYVASQKEGRRGVWRTIAQLPILMAIGIGISLNNSRAVIEALVGRDSEFVRTPKYRAEGRGRDWRDKGRSLRMPPKVVVPVLELLMGGYLIACIVLAARTGRSVVSIPFLLLFAAGYLYVGGCSVLTLWRQIPKRKPLPA